jgi:hypothetical protein
LKYIIYWQPLEGDKKFGNKNSKQFFEEKLELLKVVNQNSFTSVKKKKKKKRLGREEK